MWPLLTGGEEKKGERRGKRRREERVEERGTGLPPTRTQNLQELKKMRSRT